MSVPSLPTIDDLVTEGLAKAANGNPSASKLLRAKNVWMEEIKNDIARIMKRPRFLQITSHGIMSIGQSRYSNPSDFGHDLSLVLLDGDITGTAQAGSLGTITLQGGSTILSSDIIGKDILITSGSAQGSLSQCTGYDDLTKVATVTPDFKEVPSSNSTYLIVTTEYPVTPDHVANLDGGKTISKGRPESFSQTGDEDYGEFIFDCPPDKNYGARLRYYADIGRLDLNGTHIQTLYYKWRNLWTLGIKYRELSENDDSLTESSKAEYFGELNKLRADQYGLDLNSMRSQVVDFYG